MWAVGENASGQGVIYRTDGEEDFTAISIPSAGALRAVVAINEDNAWAVGDGGAILHFDGTQWQSMPSPTSADLHAIAIGPTGLGWIVGANGETLRFNGTGWQQVSSSTSATLRRVWVANRFGMEIEGSLDLAWAVGDNGTVMHWDGMDWIAEESGTSADLYAVSGVHSHSLRAVGANGTATLRLYGHWEVSQTPNNSVTLRGLLTSPRDEAWAVGDDGTMWFAPSRKGEFTVYNSGTSDTREPSFSKTHATSIARATSVVW
ncbi:MAG: hypothetical protein CMJ78_13800 [Planctomycetaceae bacterium]|nr:hypothetical protein [Planctomycetaceae bacterium]